MHHQQLVKFEHPIPGENGRRESNEPRKFTPDSLAAVAKAPVRQPNFGPRPTQRLHVPITPPVRGSFLPEDEELFMWMAQKCYLRQDMFLLGDPGPHLRLSILRFAQQTGREVEYISITRDTTEADLKQRRDTGFWFRRFSSHLTQVPYMSHVFFLYFFP